MDKGFVIEGWEILNIGCAVMHERCRSSVCICVLCEKTQKVCCPSCKAPVPRKTISLARLLAL